MQEALIERELNPVVEKCLPWCSCSCHAFPRFTSLLTLRTICGEVNVHYRGKRVECDEFKRRRPADFSFSLEDDLSKYLMMRYIVMAMRCISSDGPQICLWMPE